MDKTEGFEIRSFKATDMESVICLWQECDLVRPWNNPQRDIERKLEIQPEWFLVGLVEGQIIATVMAGYDGHRGWLNYLAVATKFERRGCARAIVTEAERLLREVGCPKIDLQIRTSNTQVLGFYRRIGYLEDDVISMGKRLVSDDDPGSGRLLK